MLPAELYQPGTLERKPSHCYTLEFWYCKDSNFLSEYRVSGERRGELTGAGMDTFTGAVVGVYPIAFAGSESVTGHGNYFAYGIGS